MGKAIRVRTYKRMCCVPGRVCILFCLIFIYHFAHLYPVLHSSHFDTSFYLFTICYVTFCTVTSISLRLCEATKKITGMAKKWEEIACTSGTHVTLLWLNWFALCRDFSVDEGWENAHKIGDWAPFTASSPFLFAFVWKLFVLCVLECHQMQPVHANRHHPHFSNSTLRQMWILIIIIIIIIAAFERHVCAKLRIVILTCSYAPWNRISFGFIKIIGLVVMVVLTARACACTQATYGI